MATIKYFEEIEAWKKARMVAQEIYELSLQGTFGKDFSLKDQINAAAGSVMDNIAEGFERVGMKEFIQFLSYAKGSAGEVRSQLYRATDRKHITTVQFDNLNDHILQTSKMIAGLMTYLRGSSYKGPKYLNEPEANYEIKIPDTPML